MNIYFQRVIRLIPVLMLFSSFCVTAIAQDKDTPDDRVKRTKVMSKSSRFGPGGTVVLIGAPQGALTVKGWEKHEVLVEAEITVFAANEEDAARIADVTGFEVNEDITSIRIYSIGTHDKKALKKVDKKFPKHLRSNKFRIDYTIYVPNFSDLQVDGGSGNLEIEGVEGSFRINYLESEAKMSFVGGNVQVTVGKGNVNVTISTRSWRGKQADIQLATGELNLHLPKNLNANLIARILRTGAILNSYETLTPLPRTVFSESFMSAQAGSGGAQLAFTVGDGNLKINDFEAKR